MVSIFTGLGSGFERGSLAQLGAGGLLGSGAFGRSGEQLSLNAATGNFLISQRDEFLTGSGPDSAIARTYNSLGNFSDDNGDNWRQSTDRRVHGLTGGLNSAGSTISRTSGDGSDIVYTWNSAASAYIAADGSGAYDKLTSSSGVWTWTDGSSQNTEAYEAYGIDNWRITRAANPYGTALTFSYVGANLDKVTTANGEYEQYSWSGNNITQITTGYTDYTGSTPTAKTLTRTRYGYDSSNRLTTVTVDLSPEDNSVADGKTYVTTYTYYDTSKRVATISETDGSGMKIDYNADGTVSKLTQTIASGAYRTTEITYNVNAGLPAGKHATTIKDALGQITTLIYNTADNSLSDVIAPPATSGANPQTTSFAYDANGNVTDVTDPLRKVTHYTYDAMGNVLTVTDPLGNKTERTYGPWNELLSETVTGADPNGAAVSHTTRYTYDNYHRLEFTISAEGRVTRRYYDSNSETWYSQIYTSAFYTTTGTVTSKTMSDWATALPVADQTAITDSYHFYDTRGNLQTEYFYTASSSTGGPDGYFKTISYSYDQAGQLLSRTVGGLKKETFLYDGLGRLTASTDLNGASTSILFNDASSQTVVTYANGLVETMVYDKAGNLLNKTDNLVPPTNLAPSLTPNYGAWGGNQTGSAAPLANGQPAYYYTGTSSGITLGSKGIAVNPGDTITYELTLKAGSTTNAAAFGVGSGDPGNVTVEIVKGPGSVSAPPGSWADITGLSTTDETRIRVTRHVTTSEQEYLYFLVGGTTMPAADRTNATLIVGDPLITVTAASPPRYQYDQDGQLRIATDQSGRVSYFVYDHAGRKVADVDQDGHMVEYQYDADNRVIGTVRYGGVVSSPNIATYLQNPGSSFDLSTIRPASDPGDLRTWKVYDADGRVIEAIDGAGDVTTYQYDGSSRLIATTAYANKLDVSGFVTTPPTTLVVPTADSQHDSVSRMFYDKDGLVVGTLNGEGYLTQTSYDAAGRKVKDTAFAGISSSSLWASGTFNQLLASVVANPATDRTTRYVYDGQGELRFVIDSLNHVTEYSYTIPGQVASPIGDVRTVIHYTNTIGTPSAWTEAGVTAALTSASTDRASYAVYDDANRLAYAIDATGAVTSYGYDKLGRVIRTTQFATRRSTPYLPDLATMASWAANTANLSADDRTTRNFYDLRGELQYTVDAEGYITRFDYDGESRQVGSVRFDNRIDPTVFARFTDTTTTLATIAGLAVGATTTAATTYDNEGRAASMTKTGTDGQSVTTKYFYNANGTLSSVLVASDTADQVETRFTYDGAGRKKEQYDAYGTADQRITRWSYDGLGDVVSLTDPNGAVSYRYYDHLGRVIATRDAEDYVTELTYTAFGETSSITRRANRATNPANVTDLPQYAPDPAKDAASYSYYDQLGRVIATRDADNRVTETSYNVFGEVESVAHRFNVTGGSVATAPSVAADTRDAVTSYLYDRNGRVQTRTDAENGVTTITYNAFGELATEIDPLGSSVPIQTTNSYDRRGLLKTQVVDSGTGGKAITTSYGYDAFGRQISLTNALNKVSSATYDADGRLKSKTDPLGNTTNYAYDQRGNLVAVTDAALNVTRYVYDRQDRKIAMIDALGTVTVYGYDAAGNLVLARTYSTQISLTNLPLQVTSSVYSSLTAAATDHVTRYAYDADGRLRFTVDALGHVTERVYDANGHVIHTVAYDGGIAPATYTVGAITAAVAGMPSRGSRSVYDAAGQLMFSIDAMNQVTGFTYDALGNLTRKTEYTATYGTVGDPALSAMTSWVTGNANAGNDRTTRAWYDDLGRLRYSIDAKGYVTRIDYDKAGNVTRQVAYADANTATPATFDTLTVTDLDRTYATTPATARVTQFGYDSAGRLETTTVIDDASGGAANSVSIVTKLVRDQLGQIISSTEASDTPDASTTTYVYDDAGRVVKQTRGDGTTEASATWFFYDALGRKAATVDGDNYLTVWTYDAAGQVTGETHYTNKITGSFTPTSTVAALQALARTNATDTSSSIEYDALGRVSRTIDARGSIKTNSYDAIDELLSTTRKMETTQPNETDDDITVSYAYDNFGNVIKTTDARGNDSYAYYDTLHRVIRQVDAEHFVTDTTYTRGNKVDSVKRWAKALTGAVSETTFPSHPDADALDATTKFTYDNDDRLTKVTDADGDNSSGTFQLYYEQYTLDAFGNRLAVRNKLGSTSNYTFNKRGLITSETLPVTTSTGGGSTINVVNAYSYDLRGNRTQMIEASGAAEARTTNYTYDDLDRLIQTTHDAVNTVTLTDSGLVAASGQIPTETVKYDHRGNVIERVAGGARTLNWYDAFGNLTTTVAQTDLVGGAQKGTLSVFSYDKNGNRLTAITYGDLITLPADAIGAVSSPVNGSNYRQTSYAYDRADRLISTTVAGLQTGELSGTTYTLTTADVVTSVEYDKNGNVTRQVDGRGNSIYTWYDKLGRQTARVDGENYLTTWTRDAEGNALSETRYANRITGAFTPATAASSLPGLLGTGAVDADRITQFVYDRNGRRIEERRLNVAYTSVGATGVATDIAATDISAVSKVNYTYNGLNQVLTKTEANISDASISTTARDTTTYQYDAIGRLILETDQAFKSNQWLSGGPDAQPTTAFTYDGLNNLKSSRAQAAPVANDINDRITTYIYGAGGRLASTTDPTGFVHNYGYDIAGRQVLDSYARTKADNTTTVTEGRVTRYDLAGRVITQTSARNTGSAWVFTSELAGNPAYDAVRMRYDAYGEMTGRGITVATPGTTAAFQEVFDYDAGGRLWHSNSGDGVDRFYVYDRAGNQTLTLTSAGADLSTLTASNYTASINGSGDTTIANAVTTLTAFDKRGSATATLSPDRLLATGGSAVTITTSKGYNAFGEVGSQTDARGYTTSFTYNTMGRMTAKVMPQVSVTAENGGQSNVNPTEYYSYDLAGRLVSVTDANGNRTTRVLLAGTGHGDADPLVVLERHPDNGTVTTRFNVFGDAVSVTNEVGSTTTNAYDKMGRLITVTHPNRVAGSAGNETGTDQQLVDHYVYDQLGERTGHWNSQLGSSILEKTDYDIRGRVVSTKSFAGESTTYAYSAFSSSAVTSGLGTFGGWTKSTTNLTSTGVTIVSSWEIDDYFGRTVDSQDFGAHNYDYTFDKAGKLTARSNGSGESIGFTYYNTGLVSGQTGTEGVAAYAYDAAENRIRETLAKGGITYRDASTSFDALGRMTHWQDQAAAVGGSGTATNPIATDWEYDANGNVRRANASYRGIDANGNVVTTGTMLPQDNWYLYDSMNRVTMSQGQFTGTRGSGTIVRGSAGIQIAYNADGTRATTLRKTAGLLWSGYRVHMKNAPNGQWYSDDEVDPGDPYLYISIPTTQSFTGDTQEAYSYSPDGQLVSVSTSNEIGTGSGSSIIGTGKMTSSSVTTKIARDALGRITHYQELGQGGGTSYERVNIVYDNANRELTETSYTTRSDGNFQTNLANTYTNGLLTAQDQKNYKNGNDGAAADTRQGYTYQWWDGALQSGISYDSDTGSSSNPIWNTSYTYDGSGHIVTAYIADGQPRKVNFVTDQQGLIIDRTEQKLSGNTTSLGSPRELHYRFGGLEMGQVGNNGTSNVSYVASTATRFAPAMNGTPGPFAGGSGTASPYADFDQNYNAINGSSIGNAASTYTVQGNESLPSIAAQIWGDATLWYMIASANGLTGSETLTAGQTLVIPNNVTSYRNTSETFKPYNPNDAMGDLSPTAPKPEPASKGNKCGIFGQILQTIVAVAVTIATGNPILGNITSQLFGMATGIQQGGFNWKSLAITAITAGISQGLENFNAFGSVANGTNVLSAGLTNVANDFVRGALVNGLTQGIAVATHLQDRFDFAGVAVAGVISAGGNVVSRSIGGKAIYNSAGKLVQSASFTNGLISGAASSIIGAASRSLITGSDFGDNIMAVLPDVIGSTLGRLAGNKIGSLSGKDEDGKRNLFGWIDHLTNLPVDLIGDAAKALTTKPVQHAQIPADSGGYINSGMGTRDIVATGSGVGYDESWSDGLTPGAAFSAKLGLLKFINGGPAATSETVQVFNTSTKTTESVGNGIGRVPETGDYKVWVDRSRGIVRNGTPEERQQAFIDQAWKDALDNGVTDLYAAPAPAPAPAPESVSVSDAIANWFESFSLTSRVTQGFTQQKPPYLDGVYAAAGGADHEAASDAQRNGTGKYTYAGVAHWFSSIFDSGFGGTTAVASTPVRVVEGVVNTVQHPINTAAAWKNAILHPNPVGWSLKGTSPFRAGYGITNGAIDTFMLADGVGELSAVRWGRTAGTRGVASEAADSVPLAVDQPLLLTYTPTTNTLAQIRRMPFPERWQAGEQYVQELYGSAGQQHFPVPAGWVDGEEIIGSGGRFVDAPVAMANGDTLAGEVKTYQQWRTVGGQPMQQSVPLSDGIKQQVLKDVWLRQNVQGYDPRWIFLDAPPSPELSNYLTQKNIISVTHR